MNIQSAYYKVINCIDSCDTVEQLLCCERMVINFPPYAMCKWNLVEHLESKKHRMECNKLINDCWLLCEETTWLTE